MVRHSMQGLGRIGQGGVYQGRAGQGRVASVSGVQGLWSPYVSGGLGGLGLGGQSVGCGM